ncbi:MAG TPA: type VII secretion protein EccE [Pseudonocardiaceae bacterium]|nr:type VII secretion protein EccE [Pseudonocardiaceae bacterium]
MTAAQAPPQQESTRPPEPISAPPATVSARLRSSGSHLGPLPVINLVVLEVGLALGLALGSFDAGMRVPALILLLITVTVALGRWHGQWLVRWVQLGIRYLVRSHGRSVSSPDPAAPAGTSTSQPADPRLTMLRLLLPDLTIARCADRQREPLGLAWHQGTWTAVLEVDAGVSMITPVGSAAGLPLGALASCLEDRGVTLDAIRVIWHCYPSSAALPSSSPALRSYLEVLGPLPAAARRTTWIAVRLDPRRCPAAVAERGGGVTGCHRALIGALSRVRATLESQGVPTRPLDADQLLRAGISAAELSAAAGTGQPVALGEGWRVVTAAGIGHASYAITGWGVTGAVHNLNAVTGVRALSTTLALSISPGPPDEFTGAGAGEVGLRGLIRLSARNPAELESADGHLRTVAQRLGVALSPLGGLQAAGLAATLPLGAPG